MPTNSLVAKEDWYSYVDDVINQRYECCQYIVIPIEIITGWNDDAQVKEWGSFVPETKQIEVKIENPLFSIPTPITA